MLKLKWRLTLGLFLFKLFVDPRFLFQCDDNEIVLFLDVDLKIGPDFLDRVRRNTKRGQRVIFPIMFSQVRVQIVKHLPISCIGPSKYLSHAFFPGSDTFWRRLLDQRQNRRTPNRSAPNKPSAKRRRQIVPLRVFSASSHGLFLSQTPQGNTAFVNVGLYLKSLFKENVPID